MNKLNINTVDQLTEALGVHNLLDAVLNKLDAKTAQELVSAIIKEHGLEVSA
jgi:hypothetical protein